jgi:hypothetical protein
MKMTQSNAQLSCISNTLPIIIQCLGIVLAVFVEQLFNQIFGENIAVTIL